MTFPHIPHLILAGLLGIHCDIITVRKVSVKAGGSISIPCLYELPYRNHEKYLCKGKYFNFCSYAVKTNQPSSGRFSVSDDKNQRIFTVTIKDLTHHDTHYWCAVEIDRGPDVKTNFQLSVTEGMPNLYVELQKVSAFEGGTVTITCHHKYQSVTKWCKLGSTCVADQTGSIDGTTVTINASVPDVFNVTMSELRTDSSGWYFCATEDLQMPAHLTVNELTSTTTTTISTSTADFTRRLLTTTQNSTMQTSAESLTAQPINSTTTEAEGESPKDKHKISTKTGILITLVSLLLLVAAAFFGWRIKRLSRTKPEESDISVCPQTGSNPDVLYSTIVHNQHVAAKKKEHIPEESVTYSTLKGRVQLMTEPAEGSVIYSTVHTKK